MESPAAAPQCNPRVPLTCAMEVVHAVQELLERNEDLLSWLLERKPPRHVGWRTGVFRGAATMVKRVLHMVRCERAALQKRCFRIVWLRRRGQQHEQRGSVRGSTTTTRARRGKGAGTRRGDPRAARLRR